MDVTYFRLREQAERAFAARASSEAARASHLQLADRYRDVIAAYERCAPAGNADGI